MLATYHLSRHIANFEFFSWLVMVQADGATVIGLDTSNPKTRKFTYESVMRRFHSIISPGSALAGLPSRSASPEENGLDATASRLLPWIKSGRTFTRLRSIKPATVKVDYTVTLRNNHDGAPARNSNPDTWRKFAEEINALLIEDYFDSPIDLHDRVAIYAGAKMNFGVCNGPIHMLSLTAYPVTMVVNSISATNSQIKWGMVPGEKYPWMLDNQHMFWELDTLDNLMIMFKRLENGYW